jgi:hypothetical protein
MMTGLPVRGSNRVMVIATLRNSTRPRADLSLSRLEPLVCDPNHSPRGHRMAASSGRGSMRQTQLTAGSL